MNTESFKQLLLDCDVSHSETRSHFVLKNCPNCGGSEKLQVDKKLLLWRCFKCEGLNNTTSKGNCYTFLRDVLEFDKQEIKKIMKENEVVEQVPEFLPMTASSSIIRPPNIVEDKTPVQLKNYEIPSYLILIDGSVEQMKQYPEIYRYLISRNVTDPAVMRRFRLRYDKQKMRLVFPVFDQNHNCVGLQTRDITDRHKQYHLKCQDYECSQFRNFLFFKTKEEISKCPTCNKDLEFSFYPKSSNSREFPKTEIFYNIQNIDWSKPVTLVEGPFDVINSTNAIGLMGRSLSHTQFWILINSLKNELILDLDGDAAGSESTIDVFHKLAPFLNQMRITLREDGDDPGAHSIADNALRVSQAIHPHEWFINKNLLF